MIVGHNLGFACVNELIDNLLGIFKELMKAGMYIWGLETFLMPHV